MIRLGRPKAEAPDFFREHFGGRDDPMQWFDNRLGGYSGVTLPPKIWTTNFVQTSDVRDDNSNPRTVNTVVSETGRPPHHVLDPLRNARTVRSDRSPRRNGIVTSCT